MHSTLTNALTRRWLEGMRAGALARPGGATPAEATGAAAAAAAAPAPESDTSPLGDEYIELSLLEPHKNFQNSFSVFQRRPAGWEGEPLHTMYP